MVTRSVIRITAAEATAIKASPARTIEGGRNSFANNNEILSSRHADALPGCDLMQSKSTESNTDSLKEVAAKKDYDPTEGPSTSSNKSKKRKRLNSFTIDLGDVPPQSPIPKNKRDGRTKESTSKYTGVFWNKLMNKWTAQIRIEGKARYIGNYENEDDAGIDYARAVYKYKGKDASEVSKKRQRSSSFTIDLSDAPPQSPIPKIKIDKRMKDGASKYTGVSWIKKSNKWIAMINIEGKARHIGNYDNEEEAGIDYARAVFKYKSHKRSNSFTIDLSDVPPQSPIPKIRDGQEKDRSSKYTGVNWNAKIKKWCSRISIEGKQRHIGWYDNEEDAGTDYARAVFKYRGKEALDEARVQANTQIKFELDLSDVTSISPILKSGKRVTEGLSRYVGVSFNKCHKKWMSRITVEGKQHRIGYYDSEEKAAVDYARALLKYRGQEALDEARKQATQCKFDKMDLSDDPSILPIMQSGVRASEGTSKYIGVFFNKRCKKWQSQIRVDGKMRYIGNYDSEEKAATDYARALLKYKGQEALDRARMRSKLSVNPIVK